MHKFIRISVLFLILFSTSTMAFAAFREGDVGEDIAVIQERLNALGYQIAVDGSFGKATLSAVALFQKDHNLQADGVIGAETYRYLMERDIPVSRDSSTTTVRRLLQTASHYIGVPYVFGGTTPAGFDCSGFTRYVFAKSGIALPRMADEQFAVGYAVPYNRLQPGDLVFFTTYTAGVSHSGIYLGDGKFISATSSRGIAVDPIQNSYWGPRYIGARRVL